MAHFSCPINLLQSISMSKTVALTRSKLVESYSLVPGDLVFVPEQQTLPCDMILLSG